MSKSKGNFFTLREISEKYPYEVIRFFIVSAHYRSPLNFSDELLGAAENALKRIKTCLDNISFHMKNADKKEMSPEEKNLLAGMSFKNSFLESMEDDFNTANAVTAIFEFVKFANLQVNPARSKEFLSALFDGIRELTDILGLLESPTPSETDGDEAIEELISCRQEARKNKNYAEADAIRQRLSEMGVVLEDTPVGVKWSRKEK